MRGLALAIIFGAHHIRTAFRPPQTDNADGWVALALFIPALLCIAFGV